MHPRVELPNEVKQNMERGENFAILWNGLLVVASSFFLPTAAFLILLAIYCVSTAIFSVFRNEIKTALFGFFDRAASFFGVPTVEEVIEAERRVQARQQGIGHIAIQRMLVNGEPTFVIGNIVESSPQIRVLIPEELIENIEQQMPQHIATNPLWDSRTLRRNNRRAC